jgi:hypothetical protein
MVFGMNKNRHAGGTTVTTTTTTTHTPGEGGAGGVRKQPVRGVRTNKPSLMQRLRGGNTTASRGTAAGTTATPARRSRFGGGGTRTTKRAPVTSGTGVGGGTTHHHQRKPSMGDKVSGAMLKLKGGMSGRSGEKAAGTRRMRGTDGRGSRRYY